MPSSILRDILPYLGVVAIAFFCFSLIPFLVARLCRSAGRAGLCTAAATAVAVALGLPIFSSIAQRVAPLQSFLGSAGWLGVLALPVILVVLAGSFMIWRGPDRAWRGFEIRRAIFGSLLCGFLGLSIVWRANDRVWGWSIAMSGCGIGRGTVEYVVHRQDYLRLWWGDPQGWRILDCAAALDARIAADNGEPGG